jgi:hypothetical protein
VPDYHRLDVSITLNPKKENANKRWKGQWIFGVYNLYGRRNALTVAGTQSEGRPVLGQPIMTEANQLSVIGSIIPSISYNFKFK